MVELKQEVHSPDLMKEVGFVSYSSVSDSSYYDSSTPKSSSDSG